MKRAIGSEEDIRRLVLDNPDMMFVLKAAEELNLPEWWIGAGFLRNVVWDYMEGNEPRPARDIDLVYFDPNDLSPEKDYKLERGMKIKYTGFEWEIRNQARMNYYSNLPPFKSTADGIAHWVETATCIGVRRAKGELEFLFCYGLDDLLGLIARPVDIYDTPERINTFYERINGKKWLKRWPHLKVITKTSK